jgi:hypothetical protein
MSIEKCFMKGYEVFCDDCGDVLGLPECDTFAEVLAAMNVAGWKSIYNDQDGTWQHFCFAGCAEKHGLY